MCLRIFLCIVNFCDHRPIFARLCFVFLVFVFGCYSIRFYYLLNCIAEEQPFQMYMLPYDTDVLPYACGDKNDPFGDHDYDPEPPTAPPETLRRNRSIIMCIGGEKHLAPLLGAVCHLKSFGVWTPIVVYHCGEPTMMIKAVFALLPHIKLKDICTGVDAKLWQRYQSWFCKPMALLASEYDENLIIDLDTVFFQTPNKLWHTKEFQTKGTLFFHDMFRKDVSTIGSRHMPKDAILPITPEFLKMLAAEKNYTLGASQYAQLSLTKTWNRKSFVEQDSSVVLFRKSQHSKALEVMKQLVPTFHGGTGDADLFWLSCLLGNTTFAFSRWSIGNFLPFSKETCIHGLHYDPTESRERSVSPFYMNGQDLVELRYSTCAAYTEEKFVCNWTPKYATQPISVQTHLKEVREECTAYDCSPFAQQKVTIPAFVLEEVKRRRMYVKKAWKFWRSLRRAPGDFSFPSE